MKACCDAWYQESDLFFGGLSGINFCPWCGADKRRVPPTGTAAATAAAVNYESQRQPDPLVAAARRVVETKERVRLHGPEGRTSLYHAIDQLAAALEEHT